MPGNHYSSFVEEAFIRPIRSVLIVDDDYPTFDEMLDSQIATGGNSNLDEGKDWRKNPEKVRAVISEFRNATPPLLVDIHDGKNVKVGDEYRIAAHLHQSDLLVLDYQLDRHRPGDGSTALKIIRSLMESNHFNLVVIHTSELVDKVFLETLLSMISAVGIGPTPEESSRIETLVEKAELDFEGFSRNILASIGLPQYLHSRRHADAGRRAMKGDAPYGEFFDELERVGFAPSERRSLWEYLLAKTEKSLNGRLHPSQVNLPEWNDSGDRYIAADSVFIAFSAKSDSDDLRDELQKALDAWAPEPSRLFLAKLRAEMDDYGVMAQRRAMDDRHALAHWYRRLVDASGQERKWLVTESVGRHSERLLSGLLPRVEDFASRLIAAEAAAGHGVDLSQRHFDIDLRNEKEATKARREHNALVSTKSPEGWHLTTGHIFTIGEELWVCVSPACDMVPTQLSASRRSDFGERLPFTAVRLVPIGDGKTIDRVHSNRYLFVKIGEAIRSFCFNDLGDDHSAPHWRMLYADRLGVFQPDLCFDVFVPKGNLETMSHTLEPAKVVAQLRYEYALNLVHRLGVNMTRIGLDFV